MFFFVFSNRLQANIVGSDFQNFNPTTNGVDFVTVQSGQTLSPGIINFGLFVNYGVNVIPEFKNDKPYNYPRSENRNSAIFGDFNLGLGVTSFLDFGLSFPGVLNQKIEETTSRLEFEQTGISEMRANVKLKMVGDNKNAAAIVISANKNLLIDNPFSGKDAGPTITYELVGHTSFGGLKVGLNLGYRSRKPGEKIPETPIEPLGDQMIGSLGTSVRIGKSDWRMISEIFGAKSADKKRSEFESLQKTAEALLGIKWDSTSAFACHAGVTSGIIDSAATPDWRIYAGLNYNIGPLWKDRKPLKKKARKKRSKKQDSEPVILDTFILDDILFATDSDYLINQGSLDSLKELADHLKALPKWTSISIEGHTDSVGDADYNRELSLRRAKAIARHLVKYFNIPSNKINTTGYGEDMPIADNDNFQGRRKNRRVEVSVFE